MKHIFLRLTLAVIFLSCVATIANSQTIRTRAYLHTRFETGDFPTQTDYRDWMASYWHQTEDSITITSLVGVDELSNDVALADSSSRALVTEAAVKAYVDAVGAGSSLTDGDKGDITVSGGATVWNIDADAVGSAEIATGAVGTSEIANGSVVNADLATMPANTIKGNNTAGAISPVDLTTAQVKTLLDIQTTDLSDFAEAVEDKIGTKVVAGGGITVAYDDGTGETTISGTGLSDGDKTDITVSGAGATWTIDNDAVTLAKQASGTPNRLQVFDASGNPAEGTVTGLATLSAGVLNVTGDGTGTDDQTAAEVNVTDAGGYYTGTEVETVLQELGAKTIISNAIPIPPGFPYNPPFDILRVSADSFIIDPAFDLETYANISPTDTFYVDVAMGSSGTGQSWAQAYKGLDEAITAANSSGTAKLIYVAKGYYPKDHGWNGVNPTVSLKIKGDLSQGTGDAVYLTTDLVDSVGSFTNVSNYYWALLPIRPDGVYDISIADAFGDASTLTKRASVSLVNANAGSWHWSNDTLYIRTADSRSPDSDIQYMDATINGTTNIPSKTVFLKNLNFRGYGLTATGAGGKLYLENVGSKQTQEYALAVSALEEIFVFGGEWAKTDSVDLLNYHSGVATPPNVVEYNVTAYNSAEEFSGCGNCQASTAHDTINIIRINGNYHDTNGQTIADVSGSSTWNVGTNVFNSNTGIGYFFGSAGTSAKYFLLDATSNSSTYDIQTEADAIVRYRNFTPASPVVSGAGNVYSHYTYNSDGPPELGGGVINNLTDNYIPQALGADDLENSPIYNSGGANNYIGINTVSPEAKLHVKHDDVAGSVASTLPTLIVEANSINPIALISQPSTKIGSYQFRDIHGNLGGMYYRGSNHSTLPNRLLFRTRGATLAPEVRMVIDSTGRVQMGTLSTGIPGTPESPLHIFINDVAGSTVANAALTIEKNSDDTGISILSGILRRGSIWFGDNTNNALGYIQYNMSSGSPANAMTFGTNGTSRWRIDGSGNFIAMADDTYDIGASGATRPRTGYFGTSLAVGGSIDATSIFDVTSTTKGSRPFPSLTTTQRDAIATPATGLFAYNATTNFPNYYDGTAWRQVASQNYVQSNFFQQGGNSFAGAATIGTNDANALNLETNNVTYATLSSGGGFSLTNSRLSVNGSGAMDTTSAAQITLSNTSASQFAKMQVDDSGDFNISTVSSETQLKVKNLGGTEVTGYFMCTPMTATAASAITPANGMIVYVSDTNGTFTSVGFWGYENGAWTKL